MKIKLVVTFPLLTLRSSTLMIVYQSLTAEERENENVED